MKDPDSYRQQEGLKLTDEEKRRNSFPFRFLVIALISYIVFFIALWLLMVPEIRRNFEEGRYIERYEDYRSNESDVYPERFKSILIGENGLTEVTRRIPSFGRDKLHLSIEALLMPLSEEEIGNNLYSAIPEKTKLNGISKKGKVVLIDLTPDFLKAEDIEAAKAQIEKTLSIAEDNLRVSILVGDEII